MLSIVVVVCTIGIGGRGAVLAQADIGDVMLDEVGSGFELTDESVDPSGAFTRTFSGPSGTVQIVGFSVSTPPGTRQLFEASPEVEAFDFIDEPSFDLARWVVPAGEEVGDSGFSALAFAGRDHFFNIVLLLDESATIDGPAFVLELAGRQLDAAGLPPPAVETEDSDARHEELSSLMPDAPPTGYELDQGSITLPGVSELEEGEIGDIELGDSDQAGQGSLGGVGAQRPRRRRRDHSVSVDIFAASGLATLGGLERIVVPAGLPALPPSAVVFRTSDPDQVGVGFRRGDILVVVLSTFVTPTPESTATSFAVDMAALVAPRLSDGGTTPYVFPTPPSRLVGLGLTAGFVVFAVAGATGIARLRAVVCEVMGRRPHASRVAHAGASAPRSCRSTPTPPCSAGEERSS